MALNPSTDPTFTGKIKPANNDYPLGEPRDITIPGDGTGTPWKAQGIKDNWGFFQNILDESGITPSGLPEKVGASQYLDGLKKLLKDKGRLVTLAEAVADTSAKEGDTVIISDRGNGSFEYKTGQVDNSYNIVATANLLLFLVLQPNGTHKASQYGVPTMGDAQPAAQILLNQLQANERAEFDITAMTLYDEVVRLGMPDGVYIDFMSCYITAYPTTMVNKYMVQLEGDGTDKGTKLLDGANYTQPKLPPNANTYILGVNKFHFQTTTNVEAGDWLQFHSTRRFDNNGQKETYEVQRVWEVDGNDVYTSAESKVAFEYGDEVEVRKLTDKITITGGIFDGSNVTNTGLVVRWFNEPLIKQVTIRDCYRDGILMQYNCQDEVHSCNFKRAGIPTSPEAGYSGEYGYGLIHTRNCYSRVHDCIGREGWHSFEAADGQRDITYYNCQTLSDGHGFSSHENCVSTSYINCRSQARLPMITRARYVTVQGGEWSKTSLDATFGFSGWELKIKGCDFVAHQTGQFLRPNDQTFTNMSEPSTIEIDPKIVIKGCTFEMLDGDCNSLIGSSESGYIEFSDNTIITANADDASRFLFKGNNVVIKNNHYLQRGDGMAIQLDCLTATITGNTFDYQNATATASDIINIYKPDTVGGDGIARVLLQNNVIKGNTRYAVRSYAAANSDILLISVCNTLDVTGANAMINPMTVTSLNNTYLSSQSTTGAWGNGLVSVVQGDYLAGEGSTYMGSLPTTITGLDAGMLWNDAGTVKVN